jgi:2-oxoglutarate dehydrogenase E1 component
MFRSLSFKAMRQSSGGFKSIIDDAETDAADVKRVVFCSGKIYYDLLKKKKEWNTRDIALIRIEQLYPFPHKEFDKIIKKYPGAKMHLWIQEEPENMGAWMFLSHEVKQINWIPVCRASSASPATGLNKIHQIGQQELIDKVFRPCSCELKNKYCGLQCVEGKSRIEILKQFEYIPFTK